MIFHMKTTTISLSDELYDRLKSEAAKRGRSMAEVLRQALESQLRAGLGPTPSLRDVPRHRCGRVLGPLSSDEILEEMLGGDVRG